MPLPVQPKSCLGLAIATCIGGQPAAAQMPAQNLFSGLGPEVPRLGFHTGAIVNNQAAISTVLPALPGAPSGWTVSQWGQQSLMRGDLMTQNDPSTTDPVFGRALYAFNAPDGHSHVWIYRDKTNGSLVYDLFERGGRLSNSGGSNIFLSRTAPNGGIPLDHAVKYSIDAKLSKAVIHASAEVQKSGTVLASVFTGFVIQFPEPGSHQLSTIFLQIPFSASQTRSHDFRLCSTAEGRRTIIFSSKQAGDPKLPFKTDTGQLQHIQYSVADSLKELVSAPFPCVAKDGTRSQWSVPASVTSFRDWKITGMYIGLESENRDERSSSKDQNDQGQIEVGLQFSNLSVTQDLNRPVTR